MKFGKLHGPDELAEVDFSLPSISSASIDLLTSKAPEQPFMAYVGCPMWANKEWVGKLYPPKTPQKEFLSLYSRAFNGIELNSTHYRVPSSDTLDRWREASPEGFLFSPKVPQPISHRLSNSLDQDQIDHFCEAMLQLGNRLGCSFLQLPPTFGVRQFPQLQSLLATWPTYVPLAIEFRHESWFQHNRLLSMVTEFLIDYQVATVITDVGGRRDVLHLDLTAPTAMIRFVGNGLVPSDYERVDAWIPILQQWIEAGLEQLYFFVHEPDDTFAPEMGRYVIQEFVDKLRIPLSLPEFIPTEGEQMNLF
ncbi:MAG: DUF72 domain-containing protein [Bacteroidota bacterium]